MSGWIALAAIALFAGLAWWAGWLAFNRTVSRLLEELRNELTEERGSRERMLATCLRAMQDQRDDGIRAVSDLARVVHELAAALRPKIEAPAT